MISENTREAIKALIRVDGGMTDAERSKISQVLDGKQTIKMINGKEACKMLECSRRTLRNYEMQGKIKAVRHSKRSIRFNLADVEALMINGL